MEPSDRDLMARLAAGEREALAPLVERHYRRLYRVALAYLRNPDDALDAVQETFVKVFESAPRWHPTADVFPWLVRIAVNHSIDRYRHGRRTRALMSPIEDEEGSERPLSADGPSPERRVMGQEVGERIGAALRALPERQRTVFLLRHHQEMSLEEIAQALDLRLGTVKSSLHRAVHRLRARLGGLRA